MIPAEGPIVEHAVGGTSAWFARAWEVVSDLLIATAVVWALPLSLAAAAAVVRLLLDLI